MCRPPVSSRSFAGAFDNYETHENAETDSGCGACGTVAGAGRPLCADKQFQVNLDGQHFYEEHLHEDDFHEEDDPLFDAPPGESGHCRGGAVRPRTSPALEVADVFRRFGQEYRSLHGHLLSIQQDRVLRELMVCRRKVMGYHLWQCDTCDAEVELCNSCNNRHCPKCQAAYRRQWAEQIQSCLLPVEYYHVITTVPRPVTQFGMAS